MCNFFSSIYDLENGFLHYDSKMRKEIIEKGLPDEPDSHSWICKKFGVDCDKVNKFEYNPFLKKFIVDQINTTDNREEAERWNIELFKTPEKVIEGLFITPLLNPLKIKKIAIDKKDISNLKKWDSVRASVWDSVWASVGASVWDSLRASLWASVWDSVGDSVRASVGASVGDSVGDSVRASLWASVSIYFPKIKIWKYAENLGERPYDCLLELWNNNLVPSFDGTKWRLHSGEKADIVFEITKKELENFKE